MSDIIPPDKKEKRDTLALVAMGCVVVIVLAIGIAIDSPLLVGISCIAAATAAYAGGLPLVFFVPVWSASFAFLVFLDNDYSGPFGLHFGTFLFLVLYVVPMIMFLSFGRHWALRSVGSCLLGLFILKAWHSYNYTISSPLIMLFLVPLCLYFFVKREHVRASKGMDSPEFGFIMSVELCVYALSAVIFVIAAVWL